MATNILDVCQAGANMYGVVNCPQCGSEFRWPTQQNASKDAGQIVCDDCGFLEPWVLTHE